jgi:tRNA uridine 5-carboxymethylaminomethyl modification enzyme
VAEADAVIEQAEIHTKYAGYIDKQNDEVERAAAMEHLPCPKTWTTARSPRCRSKCGNGSPATGRPPWARPRA